MWSAVGICIVWFAFCARARADARRPSYESVIVEFDHYASAARHHGTIASVLGPSERHWVRLPRRARWLPTDFVALKMAWVLRRLLNASCRPCVGRVRATRPRFVGPARATC